MALSHSPSIVMNGLVLCLDAGNTKSYPGSGTTWTDLSGRGNTGTLTNGPTYNSANGGSLVFDGTNDYWIGSNRSVETEFQYNSAFTVSSFCRITENTGDGYIINNRITDANGTQYSGWGLLHTSGQIFGFVGGLAGGGLSWRRAQISSASFSSLVYNKWCYITYVNTGVAGQQKIYLNAINYTNIVTDDTNPPYTINYSNGNSRIYVGLDGTFPHYLSGNIAQVSVYNKALTEAEVQQNFNALRGRYGI